MKIVLTTGGSAGHIFPALEVAREFKQRGHDVIFVGSVSKGFDAVEKEGFCVRLFNLRGLTGHGIFSGVVAIILMIRGFCQSYRLLKEIKPVLVLGFGSYASFPVVLAAILQKLPTAIHEQNVVPGIANRLLAKMVNKVLLSFDQSRAYFSRNAVLTGCPSRIKNLRSIDPKIFAGWNLDSTRKTILVFGGSQGSRAINQVVVSAMRELKNKVQIQVIHVTGVTDFEAIKMSYENLNIPFALFEFLDKMDEAYAISDLVICRAGAATIFELAALRIPAILIPYPHAGGHQVENARAICRNGRVQCLLEGQLTTHSLQTHILDMLSEKKMLRNSQVSRGELYIEGATQNVVKEVIALVKKDESEPPLTQWVESVGRSVHHFSIFLSTIVLLTAFIISPANGEEWNEYKQNHFIIYYKNAPKSFIKTVEDSAEEYYAKIAKNIGFVRYRAWSWNDRAKIYIYDGQDDYVNNGNNYQWSHGAASPKNKTIRTFPSAHGFFDSTLPHELAHIIFREYIGYYTSIPGWFEEGIAMYQEKAQRFGAHNVVREALKNDKFLSLKQLQQLALKGSSDPELVKLYYAESASIVNFMIQEFGEYRFKRFTRKLKEGKPFNWALDEVYIRFKNIDDLNKAWVKYLKRRS